MSYLKTKRALDENLAAGNRVVSCDATLFTYETISKLAWSQKKKPIVVNAEIVSRAKAFNILAAVSLEYGVESFILIDGYVNSEHVVQLFEEIAKNGRNVLALVDEASYFNGKVTTECHQRLFWKLYAKNVPYFCKGNWIE